MIVWPLELSTLSCVVDHVLGIEFQWEHWTCTRIHRAKENNKENSTRDWRDSHTIYNQHSQSDPDTFESHDGSSNFMRSYEGGESNNLKTTKDLFV